MNNRRTRRKQWLILGILTAVLLAIGWLWLARNGDTEAARNDSDAKKNKAGTIPTPPTYTLPPVPLPGRFPVGDLQAADFTLDKVEEFNSENRLKEGHWFNLVTTIAANERDAQARLLVRASNVRGVTVPIYGTDRWLESIRLISLPKGQWKQVETTAFVTPRDDNVRVQSATLAFDLVLDGDSRPIESFTQPTILLDPHQYLICTFDQQPARFRFLEQLDCIAGFDVRLWGHAWGQSSFGAEFAESAYHCVFTHPTDPAPWPHSVLTATTIAHAIWSDYDPNRLDVSQQQSLVDWLHWGGNLIVAGPQALERLRGSFLAPYLPAEIERYEDIDATDLRAFLARWSPLPMTTVTGSMPGCRLKPTGEKAAAEDSPWLISRRVGRGRVVAVGFPLNAEALLRWPCYSNFFNGALLGLPGRKLTETVNSSGTRIEIPVSKRSRLSFLNRDGLGTGGPARNSGGIVTGPSQTAAQINSILGQAAWNDQSEIPAQAGEILRRRATIVPRSSKFVLTVLVAYLVVLIPVNWLVFRLMGKLEWAWIAAPVISVAGALAVTRLAALDVGLTRAKDTIAVIELQAGFPRGHLAEYSALYASLSTQFQFEFPQNDALLLPQMVRRGDGGVFRPPAASGARDLQPIPCSRGQTTKIDRYFVRSNTSNFLHAERMVDIGGGLGLERLGTDSGWVVRNDSELPLRRLLVLRQHDGALHAATVDRLAARATSSELTFSPCDKDRWDELIRRVVAGPDWPFETRESVKLFEVFSQWPQDSATWRMIALTEPTMAPMACTPRPTRETVAAILVASDAATRLELESDNAALWKQYQGVGAELEPLDPPEEFD
jgi:hypothetical protein